MEMLQVQHKDTMVVRLEAQVVQVGLDMRPVQVVVGRVQSAKVVIIIRMLVMAVTGKVQQLRGHQLTGLGVVAAVPISDILTGVVAREVEQQAAHRVMLAVQIWEVAAERDEMDMLVEPVDRAL